MNGGEVVTLVRQIGGMMEAGVDILRITRVLRAQSEDPRLIELCDLIDHELTMGRGLADALSRAPDLFSPFAVSLIRQGEERNNLAGAFLRLADFLGQEQNTSEANIARARADSVSRATPTIASELTANQPPVESTAPSPHQSTAEASWWFAQAWQRALQIAATLLGALALVDGLSRSRILPAQWRRAASLSACAVLCGVWSQRDFERDSEEKASVSLPDNDDAIVSEPQSGTLAAVNVAAAADSSDWGIEESEDWRSEPSKRGVVARDEEDFE